MNFNTEYITILQRSLSIFPNPTVSNPVIKATQNRPIQFIEVYSISGTKIFSKQNINREEFVLPVGDQSKGVYIVKINAFISKKLVLH
ncbi:MAG: T9SS type A sorting domain-containing protein [Flavobacteriaceae bacterium]|nr:MAG: T9SS type A sorting domain-containing protein [Flavobacteriaceae bacterium]